MVGHHGPEHNEVISIHKTYHGALKAWEAIRLELLKEAKADLKSAKKRLSETDEMYARIVERLSCEDPKVIDNFPHETPYIIEMNISN